MKPFSSLVPGTVSSMKPAAPATPKAQEPVRWDPTTGAGAVVPWYETGTRRD